MARFAMTETALIERLRSLKSKPEMTINLVDIFGPLAALNFSQDEAGAVLRALEQDGIISFTTGNRIRINKPLPA